jgi:hypothetical protein
LCWWDFGGREEEREELAKEYQEHCWVLKDLVQEYEAESRVARRGGCKLITHISRNGRRSVKGKMVMDKRKGMLIGLGDAVGGVLKMMGVYVVGREGGTVMGIVMRSWVGRQRRRQRRTWRRVTRIAIGRTRIDLMGEKMQENIDDEDIRETDEESGEGLYIGWNVSGWG